MKRQAKLALEDSIYEAAAMRFRPIMMTTMAALSGTLPIAISIGAGSDLRQPLVSLSSATAWSSPKR